MLDTTSSGIIYLKLTFYWREREKKKRRMDGIHILKCWKRILHMLIYLNDCRFKLQQINHSICLHTKGKDWLNASIDYISVSF